MKDQLGVSIQTFSNLSKKNLTCVKRFVARCKKSDGYAPIFYWSSIEDRKNPGVNEILGYAPDKTLIAYIALYHFEEREIEVTLSIDPLYRNTAFYTIMWEQIKLAVAQYPVDITRFVFTFNQSFVALREFLNGLGARVSDFTYKLALTPHSFAKLKINPEDTFTLRKAVRADIPALLQLEVNGFQVAEVDYKNYLLQTADDPNKEIMVAVENGKIIGKVHVQLEKTSAYLYDLSIDVVEQGKGYGTQLLCRVLAQLFERSFKKVMIDASDEATLIWYKSFNFKCFATIEHRKMPAEISPIKEREKQLEAILLNFHSEQVQAQLSSQSVYKH